ncbi:hypothetical protein, partial [Streptococcus pneumoniae]|uniref:hypothetical protein n=1 Tax=Streptococcus pneumoniae TaxID=1313 RepID=UPI003F692C64
YVIITSNRTRELHDALKRRCLYHWIDYPSLEKEFQILTVKLPGISERLALQVDFQITIPEIGTIRAEHPPYVIITSNRTRELHDALKRRCLYHWIDYPSLEK